MGQSNSYSCFYKGNCSELQDLSCQFEAKNLRPSLNKNCRSSVDPSPELLRVHQGVQSLHIHIQNWAFQGAKELSKSSSLNVVQESCRCSGVY